MGQKTPSAKPYISVCIIDDNKSYSNSLKIILEQDNRIRIHSEYSTGYSFIDSLKSPFQPDVCLIDVILNDLSGIECAKRVKEKHPDIHIVVMTSYPDAKNFAAARDLGADYIEKGPRAEAFLNKIITTAVASKTERLISLQMDDYLKFEHLDLISELEKAKNRLSLLTESQLSALKLRISGKSEKEIAEILKVNPGTAHTHVWRALEKLQLPDLLHYLFGHSKNE